MFTQPATAIADSSSAQGIRVDVVMIITGVN
jgi:hypothetical protein